MLLWEVNHKCCCGRLTTNAETACCMQNVGRKITFSTPPLYMDPPPMDLGRFEISKGPSNNGGWTLDFSAV